MKTSLFTCILKWALLFLCFLLQPLEAAAQYENPHEYDTEWLYGLTKASNSGLLGGFVVRNSQLIEKGLFKTYGFELVNIKHPKEVRVQGGTGNSFIIEKYNYLYDLRAHYGRDMVLFEKAQQKGVQINALFAGGPSVGLVVPYYVTLAGGKQVKMEDNPSGDITGPGTLFRGLGETSFAPGLHAKAALLFEFGVTKKDLFGVEVGAMYEYFFKKVTIINKKKEYSAYPNVYFTVFYGWRK
ncbi:MAG: hypothetical protein MI784_09870 [Cytophagales bacterium]|nr:hypothetical protein [Cytophagales bacterium]